MRRNPKPASRMGNIERTTSETDIHISLYLDGDGIGDVHTGVAFFDHMLNHVAKHAVLNLSVHAKGDTQIDDHHTVEDVGIALGTTIKEALGDKRGIARYGDATVPMDETLILCALDFSGRGGFYTNLSFPDTRIGTTFASELVAEFFHAVARSAGLTIHIRQLAGTNAHHIAEGAFKAFGRALRSAAAVDPRVKDIPSTKGVL